MIIVEFYMINVELKLGTCLTEEEEANDGDKEERYKIYAVIRN